MRARKTQVRSSAEKPAKSARADRDELQILIDRHGGFGLLWLVARRIADDEARDIHSRVFAHAVATFAAGWARAEATVIDAAVDGATTRAA
jgi:hypothetical protein